MNFNKYMKKAMLVGLITLTTASYTHALESDLKLYENSEGKYAFTSSNGQIISDYYDYVYRLNENLFVIMKDGSEGRAIYNINNNTVSDYIYTYITASSDGDFVSFSTINHKAGLLDKEGNVLIEPTLSSVSENGAIYICFDGDKLALYDKKTNTLGAFTYDTFGKFQTVDERRLVVAEINLKYGVIDDKGDIVAPIIYDYVEDFKYRHAVTYRNSICSVINKNGEIVIDDLYDDVILSSQYIWTAKLDGKYGYIDSKGKVLIDIKFDRAEAFTSYKNAIVTIDGKKGVLGLDGSYLINPIYKDIVATENNLFIVEDLESGKFGLIDIDSNIILDIKYDSIGKFSKDKPSTITIDGKYALVNYKGEIIGNFKKIENDKKTVAIDYNTIKSFMPMDSFLKGLRDINGTVLVEPIYDWISKGSDGLYVVKKDQKEGIIDTSGQIIIPIVYESISSFYSGSALAKIDGKYRLISKENKIISDFKCDEYFLASNSNAHKTFVYKDGSSYGVSDFSGNILSEPSSLIISPLSDELLAYETDGLWGVMDLDKNIILDARYDNIYKNHNSYIVMNHGFYHVVDLLGNDVSPFYNGFYAMTDKLYRFTTEDDGLYGLYNVESQKEVLSELYPTMYTLENEYNSRKSTVEIAFKTDDPQRISHIGLLNTDGSIAIAPGDYEFYFKDEDLIKYYDYDYKAGLYSMITKKKLEPIYDSISNFNEHDLAIIKLNSKSALLNKDLDIITPFVFDYIEKFKDGYAVIRIDGKWGRVNSRGEYSLKD